jgi:amino acid transporter
MARMLWSFSRDGGIPAHQLWSAISEGTQTPILAVWAMVMFAFLLGLPMLHSLSAFQAVTSICSIGLYISCECLALGYSLSGDHLWLFG